MAEEAEFFSFGTNDLTQLTFGFSRDDAGKFLPEYVGARSCPATRSSSIDVRRAWARWSSGRSSAGARRADLHGRDLRRARRRSRERRVLPPRRPRLRVVLAVPRADRAARRRPGRAARTRYREAISGRRAACGDPVRARRRRSRSGGDPRARRGARRRASAGGDPARRRGTARIAGICVVSASGSWSTTALRDAHRGGRASRGARVVS